MFASLCRVPVLALLFATLLLSSCGLGPTPTPVPVPEDTTDYGADVDTLAPNRVGTALDQPIPTVEQYLAGLREFDARKMWDAYGDEARQEIEQQGGTLAILQSRLDQAKAGGGRYEKFDRIGTYLLADGRAFCFYVATRRGFPNAPNPEQIFYVFTVDPQGKILEIK